MHPVWRFSIAAIEQLQAGLQARLFDVAAGERDAQRLELSPRYWATTRARLDAGELARTEEK